MAIAGTLAVNILARTDKFNKGIKSARKSLSGFGKSIATVGKGVVGFGATLVGVAGVAGFGVFAKSQIDSAVLLGDTADKLGIATDKLELMRFAAEATGVSQTALDTALQRMVRRVGEASRGFGSAAKTLDALGLNAKKLNKLAPDQMFNRIGDAVRRIPDKGGQLASMMAVFDTEGVGLLNTAAVGVDSFAQAFERAGGATASKGIENAREFSLAVQEMKAAIGATGRDFVLGVTPAALEAVRGLQVLLDDLRPKKDPFRRAGKPDKRGAIGGVLGGAQLFGADILRSISTGKLLPLQASINRGRQLDKELAGPRLTPAEFERGNRDRAEQRREQRKQTRILIESLEIQRRAVLDRQATVVLEAATFE